MAFATFCYVVQFISLASKVSNINCRTVWLVNRQRILKQAELLRSLNFNNWGCSNDKDRSKLWEGIISYVTCLRLNYTTQGKNTFSGIQNVLRLLVWSFMFVWSFTFVFLLGGGWVINPFSCVQRPYMNSYLTHLLVLNINSSTDTIIEVPIGLNALPCSHWRQLHPFQKLTLADFSSSDF